MKKIAVILAALMMAACSTTPKNDAPQPEKQATAPVSPSENKAPAPVSTGGTEDGKLNSGGIANKTQSVYFEFNKATITSEYKALIQQQAKSIKGDKQDIVTLEGNCDERGSAEYNLGLGQRRADAVKKLMVVAGVPASQLKTVSLGKEKPKLSCHDESCWKENRRVDLVRGS